ncbi:MAG: preprotein translocase subunit SecE [Patescibacteria group bacterium]
MADGKPAKKTKRLVKNPETFRERALKASEVSDKPRRSARIRKAGGQISRPVIKPVRRVASNKLFRKKPFRLIGKLSSFIGKVIFPVYFRNSWKELKQVTWPRWKESRQLTFAVIVFAIIFGAAIAAVDYGLDKLFRDILLK